MELSFILLLFTFAFTFAASGGAWAHGSLGARLPIYASGQWLGLGVPSVVAAALALACVAVPQFDVSFVTLAIGVGLSILGAALGLRATPGTALARGFVWPLAACTYVWALAQAVGIA